MLFNGDKVLILGACTLDYLDYVGQVGVIEHSYVRIGEGSPDSYRVRFLDNESRVFLTENLILEGVPYLPYLELFE